MEADCAENVQLLLFFEKNLNCCNCCTI